jgi:hypothetical protein
LVEIRCAGLVSLLVAVGSLTGSPSAAQQPDRVRIDTPIATARRTTGTIHIDGRLDEPDWGSTPSIGPLTQREPLEGLANLDRPDGSYVRLPSGRDDRLALFDDVGIERSRRRRSDVPCFVDSSRGNTNTSPVFSVVGDCPSTCRTIVPSKTWFETELLTPQENLAGLMAVNRDVIGRAETWDRSDRTCST